MIRRSPTIYGRDATDQIEQAKKSGIEGARMLIESFYYAFNQRDLEVLKQIWSGHELIQLNNPLGGMLRGTEIITMLYYRLFKSSASVWVEFRDIVEFETDAMVVFAGREQGEFSVNNQTLRLAIRTSRVVQWFGVEIGWRQVHHHGSIDDPGLLAAYQQAVCGASHCDSAAIQSRAILCITP